jgi:cytochrome c-type biogenesis protein
MEISQVTLGLAFLAGLASFLSPCVFPLVPAYVSYLSGETAAAARTPGQARWNTFTHGLAFVLGFSVVFILLGAAASAMGGYLDDFADILARLGGIVVILFGLHMSGLLRIPFLLQDTRLHAQQGMRLGYISSFLMGIFFSAGWSPCVGPVLGAILTISFSGKSVLWGTILLAVYSSGLAIPFLAAALGIGWVVESLRKFAKTLHVIEVIMAIILMIVGGLLVTGMFSTLARLGNFINFGL